MKYADEIVPLAKDGTVQRSVVDRLMETGRCCGVGMNVGKTEVLRI